MMPAPGVDGADLLAAAGSAEHRSRHPVARAVVAVAEKARLALTDPTEFEEIPGRGVRATVDGAQTLIGRRAWVAEQGPGVTFVGPYDVTITRPARLALVLGEYRVEDLPDEQTLPLRFTGVWEHRNGRWQCLTHHNSEIT